MKPIKLEEGYYWVTTNQMVHNHKPIIAYYTGECNRWQDHYCHCLYTDSIQIIQRVEPPISKPVCKCTTGYHDKSCDYHKSKEQSGIELKEKIVKKLNERKFKRECIAHGICPDCAEDITSYYVHFGLCKMRKE
jgi:hypothetical protein